MQNSSRRFQILSSSVYKFVEPLSRRAPLQSQFRGFASKEGKDDPCEPDHSWEKNPDCNVDECEEKKRLDDVCPVDPSCDRGPFLQTWAECPPRILEEIPFCLGDKLPIRTPRKGKIRPIPKQEGLCRKDEICSKIRMPGCKEVNKVIKCKRTRMPSDCVPEPTPCLSFSECEKELPPWKHPSECNCYEKACKPTDE